MNSAHIIYNLCSSFTDFLVKQQTLQVLEVQYIMPVKWEDETSARFSISNGVKQGGVISPLLFSLHIDELFLFLKQSGLDCHIRLT